MACTCKALYTMFSHSLTHLHADGGKLHCSTASSLLGRLSTRFRIFYHSSQSTFMRSDTDAGWESLAHSLHFNLSQICSVGLRLELGADPSSSSTKHLLSQVSMDLAFYPAWVVLYCSHKVETWNCRKRLGKLKHCKFLSQDLRC